MKKTKRWWIACSTFNWFDGIHINSGLSEYGNWNGLIYFESEKEAKDFEKRLKNFIYENYPRAKNEGWYVADK